MSRTMRLGLDEARVRRANRLTWLLVGPLRRVFSEARADVDVALSTQGRMP